MKSITTEAIASAGGYHLHFYWRPAPSMAYARESAPFTHEPRLIIQSEAHKAAIFWCGLIARKMLEEFENIKGEATSEQLAEFYRRHAYLALTC